MNKTHTNIQVTLLHQLFGHLSSVPRKARPQQVLLADYQSISWQRKSDLSARQSILGKSRLTVLRFAQPPNQVNQIGVTVVTSAALDLANMLSGEWNPQQPNTLNLGQIARLLDVASWVSGALGALISGQFSTPTVIEGADRSSQFLEKDDAHSSLANVLIGVLPFEVARLCTGYLILSIEIDQETIRNRRDEQVGSTFRLDAIVV